MKHIEFRNILGLIVVLLTFGTHFILHFKGVPSDNKDMVNILSGTLYGGMMMVIGYYFGSSKSTPKVTSLLPTGTQENPLNVETTIVEKKIKEYTDGTVTITIELYDGLSDEEKAKYNPVYE